MFIFVIDVYKRDVVAVVKMVSIFMGYTFSLWEAIIPIYGNAANTKLGNTYRSHDKITVLCKPQVHAQR